MRNYCKFVIILVILVLLCDGANVNIKKVKSGVSGGWKKPRFTGKTAKNVTSDEQGRGFASSLLSFGRVFNFFPVGGERECQPSITTVARAGICLNPYDCHQRSGKASGDCAHGLGVCCVFEVTCGGVVENNLTYFNSPGFPEPWSGEEDSCDITIHKTHAGITQLRIDFVQFTIGQPNRMTGECDEDAMILGEGDGNFTLCGQNYGQHLYYTLTSTTEKRDADDLASTKSTRLSIRMRGSEMPRIWLMRLAQMPLAYSAPHNCLQYYTNVNGTIKTFNYAYNGRYLSGHEYRACIRKNTDYCSVRYTPCDNRSFRIGPGDQRAGASDPTATVELLLGPGESGGAGTGFNGTDGAFGEVVTPAPDNDSVVVSDQEADENIQNETQMMDEGMLPADGAGTQGMMPADNAGTQQDEIENDMEGSGADPNIAPIVATPAPPSLLSRIWSFMWPSWIWGQRRLRGSRGWSDSGRWDSDSWESERQYDSSQRRYDSRGRFNSEGWRDESKGWGDQDSSKTWKWMRWSPYAQHYTQEDDKIRYYGYGNNGIGLKGFGRQRCTDRITIACESEYFVSSTAYVPGVCDPHHCGGNFCPGVRFDQCRVETSISPFAVSVHFGPPTLKRNPEDNIGVCLRYNQLPCND